MWGEGEEEEEEKKTRRIPVIDSVSLWLVPSVTSSAASALRKSASNKRQRSHCCTDYYSERREI